MRGGSVGLLYVTKVNESRPLFFVLHLTLLRMNNNVFVFKAIPKQMLFIDLLLQE
jgi:hypothetical protein